MFQFLFPAAGVIIAVGLFFAYVQPTFNEAKLIEAEAAQYEEAVLRASELQQRVNELKSRQSNIPVADLERLEAFLPTSFDEVTTLLDLSVLADQHNLTFSNSESDRSGASVPVEDPDESALDGSGELSSQQRIRSQYEANDVVFSVSGSYEDFKSFLADIERSLRFSEVMSIGFEEPEGDLLSFALRVRFYSLDSNRLNQ